MSSIVKGSPGYVYLMSSDSLSPGLLKIGATTDLPEVRAKQLTAATASPTPFFVVYSRAVSDCNAVEELMHRAFADRRVNENREFFRVSVYEAAKTLDRLAGGKGGYSPKPATPWAELFSTFPDDDGKPRDLTEDEMAKCRELAEELGE